MTATAPTMTTDAILAAPLPGTTAEIDAQIAALDAARRDPAIAPHTFGALSSKMQQLRLHRDPIAEAEAIAAAEENNRRNRELFERAYDEQLRPLDLEFRSLAERHVALVAEMAENLSKAQELSRRKSAAWAAMQAGPVIADDPERPLPGRAHSFAHTDRIPEGVFLLNQHDFDTAAYFRQVALRDLFGREAKNAPAFMNVAIPTQTD